jgi:hypothetical protein
MRVHERKSVTGKNVRKRAADLLPATAADLARLREAMAGPIDTSDIPEKKGSFRRHARDSAGRLPARKSMIRDAIVHELKHLKMTPYRLWKQAKTYCPTLSQSAVHEFIKGKRQLELPYAEALMSAVNLGVARSVTSTPRQEPAAYLPTSKAAIRRLDDDEA